MILLLFLFGLFTLIAGICAISLRNLVHCGLWAFAFFFGIAALFFTLRAEFLGAVQVIIYVGAIAILILFVTMLVQQAEDQAKPRALFGASGLFGAVTAFGVAGVILISLFKESFVRGAESALEKSQDKLPSMPVRALGEAMMTPYVIPFEIVSILLTAALVGAIVLALEKGAPDSSSNSGGES